MNDIALTVFASVALLCAAPCQSPSTTSPKLPSASPTGNSQNYYPFGTGQMSYQQVHSAWSFTDRTPRTIRNLMFTSAGKNASTVELEIWMAKCPHGSEDAASKFEDNVVPGTEVKVVNRRVVNLPAGTNGSYDIDIPFDRPFSWDGGHLSWRVNVHASGGSTTVNYFSVKSYFASGESKTTGTFGGCQSANGTQNATHFASMRAPGMTSRFFGNSFVPSGGLTGLVNFGMNTSTTSSGLPLPFDLDQLGATGCMLTTDIAVSIGATTNADARGSMWIDVPIPNERTFAGMKFRTQCAFLERGANPLGVFFSNGQTNSIGYRRGVCRITSSLGGNGSVPDQATALVIGLR